MTQEQIHRLAEEYAESQTYGGNTDKYIPYITESAESFMQWLLQHHYIVAKDKVADALKGAEALTEAGRKSHLSSKGNIGAGMKAAIHALIPETIKHDEP